MPLTVAGTQELESGRPKLLPIEEEQLINGIPTRVKIKYLAEIVSAKEKEFTNGGKFLELQLAVDFEGQRTYIRDLCSYDPRWIWKLSKLVTLLGINPKTVDETDFIGRFVIITVRNNSFKLKDGSDMIETGLDNYERQATLEEVNPQATEGNPF